MHIVGAILQPAGLLLEVPKGMCMPASLQGRNVDQA